jgi:hypothetical protein
MVALRTGWDLRGLHRATTTQEAAARLGSSVIKSLLTN